MIVLQRLYNALRVPIMPCVCLSFVAPPDATILPSQSPTPLLCAERQTTLYGSSVALAAHVFYLFMRRPVKALLDGGANCLTIETA